MWKCLVFTLLIAIPAAPATAQSTGPATIPTTRPGYEAQAERQRQKEADKILRDAARDLTKEARQIANFFQPTRDEPNYFQTTVDAGALTQSDVLRALTRTSGGGPEIDAYVKWQLLSAVKTFDAEHARALLELAVNAPAYYPHPSSDAKLRTSLEREMARTKSQEQIVQLEEALSREVESCSPGRPCRRTCADC
jgi:hypothetical protein